MNFIAENLATIIITLILIGLAVLAILKIINNKKKRLGCSSCGSYSNCENFYSYKKTTNNKKEDKKD